MLDEFHSLCIYVDDILGFFVYGVDVLLGLLMQMFCFQAHDNVVLLLIILYFGFIM